MTKIFFLLTLNLLLTCSNVQMHASDSAAEGKKQFNLKPSVKIRTLIDGGRECIADLMVTAQASHVTIIDPFFRAPGLSYAYIEISRSNEESGIVHQIPRVRNLRNPTIGSVTLPFGGITGGSVVCTSTVGKSEQQVEFFMTLVLLQGSSTSPEGWNNLKPTIAIKSHPVSMGKFPEDTNFNIGRCESHIMKLFDLDAGRLLKISPGLEATIHIPNTYPDRIPKVQITFANHSHSTIRLFDPYLSEYPLTTFPGTLSLVDTESSTRTRLLQNSPGSYVLPHIAAYSDVPPFSIVGGTIGFANHDKVSVGELELVLFTNFLFDPKNWINKTCSQKEWEGKMTPANILSRTRVKIR